MSFLVCPLQGGSEGERASAPWADVHLDDSLPGPELTRRSANTSALLKHIVLLLVWMLWVLWWPMCRSLVLARSTGGVSSQRRTRTLDPLPPTQDSKNDHRRMDFSSDPDDPFSFEALEMSAVSSTLSLLRPPPSSGSLARTLLSLTDVLISTD